LSPNANGPQPDLTLAQPAAWRDGLAVTLLALAFTSACFFYGVGYNLLFLFVCVVCTLVAAALAGSSALIGRMAAAPFAALLALYALVALLLVQLVFSISPESSNAPSWIVALLPIWFFVASSVSRQSWLWLTLVGLVTLIAVIAFGRFLLDAQRAYDPLADPGNLGAMLYLVWIPVTHWLLVRCWYGPRWPWLLPCLAVFTLICITPLFATASRAAQALAIAAVMGWFVLALIRRVSVLPVLWVALSVAAGFALFYLRSPELLVAMADSSEGAAVQDQRSAMLGAAWQALQAQGWWGSGIFTFSLLYPMYRTVADQSSVGIYVHNDFLQLLLEGGVLLALPLLLLMVGVGYRCLKSLHPRTTVGELQSLGGYWALAALCAHSMVNFVFYTPALAALAGVVAAWSMSHRRPLPPSVDDKRGFFGWLFGLALGFVAVAYLALDVANLNVFSGQPGLGVTERYRATPADQLRFARLSEQLNGDRGLPVLGQALLLQAQLKSKPDSEYLREQTLASFRRALQKDPWNPDAYLHFADHLLQGRIVEEETPEALIKQALAINPKHVPSILALVDYYDLVNQPERAYVLLRQHAYPWLDHIAQGNPKQLEQLLTQLGRRALAADDQVFFAQLRSTRERLLARPKVRYNPIWFMERRSPKLE
jgi:O-antigen ligase